jgi:hypothetical protein
MTGRAAGFGRVVTHAFLGVAIVLCCSPGSHGQGSGLERTFPQSKARVEKALQEMQPATAGRLPVLDGFAICEATIRPSSRSRQPLPGDRLCG